MESVNKYKRICIQLNFLQFSCNLNTLHLYLFLKMVLYIYINNLFLFVTQNYISEENTLLHLNFCHFYCICYYESLSLSLFDSNYSKRKHIQTGYFTKCIKVFSTCVSFLWKLVSKIYLFMQCFRYSENIEIKRPWRSLLMLRKQLHSCVTKCIK